MTICAGIFTCSGIDLIFFILYIFSVIGIILGRIYYKKKFSLRTIQFIVISGILIIPVSIAIDYSIRAKESSNLDRTTWATGCATAISRGCNLDDFKAETGLKIPYFDPFDNDKRSGPGGASVCLTGIDDTCNDNTLFEACKRTQGVTVAEECRKKCCGGP